jgi:hypothetical protein
MKQYQSLRLLLFLCCACAASMKLSAENTDEIIIQNRSGKRLSTLQITFAFFGQNNIRSNNYMFKRKTEGIVTEYNIAQNAAVTIRANEAKRRHISKTVQSHFIDNSGNSTITNICVTKIKAITHGYPRQIERTFHPCSQETNFVITTKPGHPVDHYIIETLSEHREAITIVPQKFPLP